MAEPGARFAVGEVVRHRMFDYRGVVLDVDASFQLSDEWYDEVARSRPPRDEPWYHVLVDEADHVTYVAERNLDAEAEPRPIQHPLLERHFEAFENGRYRSCQRRN